jgi:hypothetical protein
MGPFEATSGILVILTIGSAIFRKYIIVRVNRTSGETKANTVTTSKSRDEIMATIIADAELSGQSVEKIRKNKGGGFHITTDEEAIIGYKEEIKK